MSRKKQWSESQLRNAVDISKSYRNVIKVLGLIPAGGNYNQIKRYIKEYGISTEHFTGMLWNKGLKMSFRPKIELEAILQKDTTYQSFKLKKRLFLAKIKKPKCEICGWARKSVDGRIPLELDHINGDRYDNRLENLRILCPNCHSLQTTHRGKNRKCPSAEIGRQPSLKMM